MPCSDHGSDALLWASGEGDSELDLVRELLGLTGGAGIDRESARGETALTVACARRVNGIMFPYGPVKGRLLVMPIPKRRDPPRNGHVLFSHRRVAFFPVTTAPLAAKQGASANHPDLGEDRARRCESRDAVGENASDRGH